MKAIILAAGKGVRMRPLTERTPKPLLPVLGKSLLHHLVSQFPEELNELIIVVGYLEHKVREHCGSQFLGKTVQYITQEKLEGPYQALELCRPLLKDGERFCVFYADDLLDKNSITELLKHKHAATVSEVDEPQHFGIATLNPNGTIKEIEEKPEHPVSNLALTSGYVLNTDIFAYKPRKHSRGEYFLSNALAAMAQEHSITAVRTTFWFPIATPEDLKRAETLLRDSGLFVE